MDREKLASACAAIEAFFNADESAIMEHSDWRRNGQTFSERVEGHVLGVIESLENELENPDSPDGEDLDEKHEPLLETDEEGYAKVWVVLCRIPDCFTTAITFIDVMASEETAQRRAQGHREALVGATYVGNVVVVPTVIQIDNSIDGVETFL